MTQFNRIISDGVIRVEVRTITTEADARYAAAVVASRRDAVADGVSQDGEPGYWLSKCLSSLSSGTLLGLYVNGGMPCGASVVERSTLGPEMILLAAASLWDAENTEPALKQAAIDVAASFSAPLFEQSYVVTPLPEGSVAVDASGAVMLGVAATRQRVLNRLG